MSKETTTMVLAVDKNLNMDFKEYCKLKNIRYPRELAIKILEKELHKLIIKGELEKNK